MGEKEAGAGEAGREIRVNKQGQGGGGGGGGGVMLLQQASREGVKSVYAMEEEIGRGCYGIVRIVRERRTGERFACKTVLKAKLQGRSAVVRREVEALGKLAGHPNVVGLRGLYEDERAVHLVMELCNAGDLCDEINRRSQFKEKDALRVFKQVAAAVAHCHQNGVMHRDLKPENVLLCRESSGHGQGRGRWSFWNILAESDEDEEEDVAFSVKLGDFGQAVSLRRGDKMEGQCGSLYYLSPEMFLGRRYGLESDIWSLGILLWALLTGKLPFQQNDKESVKRAVCSGRLDFSAEPWSAISDEAKDLIRRMLALDPSKRLTVEGILAHPWLAKAPSPAKPLNDGVGEKCGRKESCTVLNGSSANGTVRAGLPISPPSLSHSPPAADFQRHFCHIPPCNVLNDKNMNVLSSNAGKPAGSARCKDLHGSYCDYSVEPAATFSSPGLGSGKPSGSDELCLSVSSRPTCFNPCGPDGEKEDGDQLAFDRTQSKHGSGLLPAVVAFFLQAALGKGPSQWLVETQADDLKGSKINLQGTNGRQEPNLVLCENRQKL